MKEFLGLFWLIMATDLTQLTQRARAGALVVVGNLPRPDFLGALTSEGAPQPGASPSSMPDQPAATPMTSAAAMEEAGEEVPGLGAPSGAPPSGAAAVPLSAAAAAAASGFRRSIAGDAAWLALLAGLVGGAGTAARASRLALPGPALNPKPAAAGTLAARGALAAHHLLADAASRGALLAHCTPGGGGGGINALLRALVQAAGAEGNKARSGPHWSHGTASWECVEHPQANLR